MASARAELAACKLADVRRNEIAELLTKKRNHVKNKTEEYDKKEVKLREVATLEKRREELKSVQAEVVALD